MRRYRENICFLKKYVDLRKRGLLLFFLFLMVFLGIFLLYHVPMGAFAYPAGICCIFGILYYIGDFQRMYRRHWQMCQFLKIWENLGERLPEAEDVLEEDYQELVRFLLRQRQQMEEEMSRNQAEMEEYYTTWVHQIKTPIASIRLNLQNEDSDFSRLIFEDLFRIEQYVDMVLCYLRLDGNSTDYLFREYELDDIIRQAVKKYAGQFIRRKISLNYETVKERVLTDEKWLLFVLEQVLSNALKYTEDGGSIAILFEQSTLIIRDTGIGIAPEDLPRIFERGYTGYNGRNDKRASGLGLYLCRRICQNLGHTIAVDSVLGEGTAVRIGLDHRNLEVE